MKKELHPELKALEVTCSSCGEKFSTDSTTELKKR